MKFDIDFSSHYLDNMLGGGTELADERSEVVEQFKRIVAPSGGYRLYDSIAVADDCFVLDGHTFHCGGRIARALHGATALAVFAVTVGDKVSSLERQYNAEFDYIKSYWCDKLANITLGKVLEILKIDIGNEINDEGLHITSHWGPGYCGWDLFEQGYLLPLSPAEELGITLSPSMLMSPVKSMSGVVGIGRNVVYKESGCSDCLLDKCAYRSMKW